MIAGDAPQTLSIERRLTADQAARRIRVREAARELAAEGGYGAVTMQAVADRSGVARATIYRYFTSKDHLLAEVIAEWGRQITADLRRSPPQGALPERVVGVFARVIEAAQREPRLTAAVLASATSADPEAIRAQGHFASLIRTYLETALGAEPVPRQGELEILMGHVFFSALVHMTGGRIDGAGAIRSLEIAARTFFRAGAVE
jgi:AcrR family transcriptional regulator